jgi:NTP pyrophosphatase (non-canonical NTP hydrolase)
MQDLLDQIQKMRIAKGWDQSDTFEILAKSTLIEAAELLECFTEEGFQIDKVKGEIADVLMYVLSLAMDLNLDPKTIILEKFNDIHERYPNLNHD